MMKKEVELTEEDRQALIESFEYQKKHPIWYSFEGIDKPLKKVKMTKKELKENLKRIDKELEELRNLKL